jgi:hypothetical protein
LKLIRKRENSDEYYYEGENLRWGRQENYRYAIEYPITLLFDNKNNDFIEGRYGERITDAFNYILNSFPKEKLGAQKKEIKRDDGF